MKTPQKVASWYWIVAAILTPFVALACVLTGYFAYQSQSYRAEADRLLASLRRNHEDFEHLRTVMTALGTQVGFVAANPEATVATIQVKAIPGNPEEEQRPVQDRNYVYNKMREGVDLYQGNGKYVQNYTSAREYLDRFEKQIERYIAFKAYQIYDVKTIEIGNLPVGAPPGAAPAPTPGPEGTPAPEPQPERVVVAGDVVERPGHRRAISAELTQEAYLPAEAEIDRAFDKWKNGDPPREHSLKKPTVITLELIFRRQMHLLDELVSANVRQYGILIGEVTSGETGFGGVETSKTRFDELAGLLSGKVTTLKTDVTREMGGAASADGEIAGASNDRKVQAFDAENVLRTGALQQEAQKFQAELEMHKNDADAFRDLARRIPRIKMPKAVPNSEWDGQINYSDDKRGTIHINLGRLDHVVAGQRFEVWRTSGRERDQFVGVIEIVRTLSDYFSLCTVLELADPAVPVRKNDRIMSHLWHKGKFLTIALHGTFEPPEQAFSKQRLTALLQQAGCRVVEKLQPGTDLVITGAPRGLAEDEWFKTARADILVDTITEEMVRLYLQPR